MISRHREGQETSESDPHQGKLQKNLAFCTHPMYAFLGVKPAYICEKGFKSHVWKFLHVFRDDLGNIKGTKMVHGVLGVCRGTGKAIKG